MTSSKPSHLPEAPSPNTNILEVWASPYEFGEGMHIQSITLSLNFTAWRVSLALPTHEMLIFPVALSWFLLFSF